MKNHSALYFTLIAISLPIFQGLANAHEIFQDVLKEKYGLKSFSCKTCHPIGDDNTIRSPLADLYHEALTPGKWLDKYYEAEEKGEDAVKEFEQEVAKAFKQVLEDVGKKSISVDDLFESGLLAGIRIDDKKRAKPADSKADDSKDSSKPDDDSASAVSAMYLKRDDE